VPGLGTTYGRGGATNAQWDIQNAQCVLIEGSNMAENHPIAFRFVMQAKARGATIIHVDPRFSRTSAMADIHVPIRPGSDIAWLGGLINYMIQNELYFKEYVTHYTNAANIIEPEFLGPEDLDGVFSGLDREERDYDIDTWQYRGQPTPAPNYNPTQLATQEHEEATEEMVKEPPPKDFTLQHPNCIFQLLKRHYSRYTPEMVERICGIPQELFLKVANTLAANSGRERTTALCYAVGWTQHTTGVQMIRAGAVLQLLMGNIGRPGGGVIALRGHASIQGATDIPTLYDLLPGYLGQPAAEKNHDNLNDYLETEYAPTSWWAHYPQYIVSLLKAWYGDNAREENEYCFDHLPRITGDHSQLPMTMAINDGEIKGFFLMGQNPAVGGHNTRFVRRALANLEWMVVRDPYENETAAFWYDSEEVKRGEMDPSTIGTEIFLLPAAVINEKEGTFTNTHRLIQWHDQAVEPPGDCRSELWFLYHLCKRLKELYRDDPEQDSMRVRQILDLTWDYPLAGPHQEPDPESILLEINGYRCADRRPMRDYTELKDDGSTASGCWIYSGVMPSHGVNLSRNRRPDPPDGPGTHLNWAYSWPSNRRILYNRASADPDGKPWSDAKKYTYWDEEEGEWKSPDNVDFPASKRPDYEPDWSEDPRGLDAHSGRAPFLLMPDGLGWLYVASGLQDGPMPTHYEPVESPVPNPLYDQQSNPVAKLWERPDNPYHEVGDPRYPYVITTYRLTEHHTGGTMSRWVPWLAELQPEGFAEISPELAREKDIQNGEWVTISTARGEIETRALVTARMKPLVIDGRTTHVVGMPWHFGNIGIARGAIANDLSAIVGEANISIHEGKVFTCNLRAGRREAS
jgi:formate dehydrogenase major subunit